EQFSAELAELGNDIWLNAALFQRVNSVYEQRDVAGAHTNPYIQSLDEQFSAELAELGNDIWLNAALFQRVNSVYEQRD
ncbi:hypothetical protein C5706_32840, partial [Klebsiella pneumoniae]